MTREQAERQITRPHPQTDVNNIRLAILDLKAVRDRLRFAGANKAADYVARALKSVEGAERHAKRKAGEHARAIVNR
jgi:hypothetical protein